MKKSLLILLVQLVSLIAIAQQATYITQTFSTVPPSGWTIDAHSSNWFSNPSVYAGGTSPECFFYKTPNFIGDSRLITSNLNTTGATTLTVSFKHYLSHYSGAYTVGVASRSNGGAWTTVWSIVNPTASVGPAQEYFSFSNADIGVATTQLCFFFSGTSANIDAWVIDDLTVFSPYTLDAKMKTITVSPYLSQGNVNITGTVINYGTSNVTSLMLNYNINSGTTNSITISPLNLAPGQSYNYTIPPVWAATPGVYSVKAWISEVNGATPDNCQTNDTLTKTVTVASQTTTRLPLFEEFTSSTCSPCASFNANTFSPFTSDYPDAFSLIKYQMNWPGAGDPYYTAEGGVRKTYYGVSGVPIMYVDGTAATMTYGGMVSALSSEAAKPTFFEITTTPTYNGTTITIPITIDSYMSGSFKVYTVVVEKTTTGNGGTNGETSWEHVMMKMYPNGNGQTVNIIAGTPYTHTYTGNLSTTHVEEMSDLQVVCFIQESSTKEVFQSKFADVVILGVEETDSFGTISVYPNPVSDYSFIHLNLTNAESVSYKVYNILGDAVYAEDAGLLSDGKHSLGFNVKNLNSGMYFISMQIGDNKITRKISVNR